MADEASGLGEAPPAGHTRAHAVEMLLGRPPEQSYDRIARLAAASLRAPMAFVSVAWAGRHTVMGSVGVSGRARAWRAVPGSRQLLEQAISEGRLVTARASTHDKVRPAGGESSANVDAPVGADDHAAIAGPSIAIAPFHCRADDTVGAICVAAVDPMQEWTADDLDLLRDLAEAMRVELDLRREVVIQRDTQEALVQITLHDELTGLPNRALFSERLHNAISRAQRDATVQFAVLFLDLDQFKVVNDSIGHLEGDAMLIVVAERLVTVLRPEDTVARLGGDEFAILIDSLADAEDAALVAERIQVTLRRPIDLGGYEVFTSASIGIVLSSSSFLATELPEHLLRSADMAMYRAKDAGRGRFAVFDRAMHSSALARLQLETDLRHALERNEFRVLYQPVISLATGQIVGAEALLRWQHPQQGVILPSDFVPLAEDTGLIVGVGEWVLRTACREIQQLTARHPEHSELSVAVNLSIKQFNQADLVARVGEISKACGLTTGRLVLEITESVVVDQPESAREVLAQFKALGARMYMDDFGTGYSSLAYLHQLPLDGLKVDRAFVGRMDTDERSRQLVATVLQMAHGMGLETVAEGVATLEQLAQLRAMGCQLAQGFLFSAPLEPQALAELVASTPQW